MFLHSCLNVVHEMIISNDKRKYTQLKKKLLEFCWEVGYTIVSFLDFILYSQTLITLSCRMLIDYTETAKQTSYNSNFIQAWKGYSLVALFFVTILIQSLMFHQQSYWSMTLGMRVSSALMSAVYRKVSVMLFFGKFGKHIAFLMLILFQ